MMKMIFGLSEVFAASSVLHAKASMAKEPMKIDLKVCFILYLIILVYQKQDRMLRHSELENQKLLNLCLPHLC